MEKHQKLESNVHSPLTGGHRWNDCLPYAQALDCIAKGMMNKGRDSRIFAEDRLYFILNEMAQITVLEAKNEEYKKYIDSLTDENETLRVQYYDALINKLLEEIEKLKQISKNFRIKTRKDFKDDEIKSYDIPKNDEIAVKEILIRLAKILDEVSYFLYDKENTIESGIQNILS